MSNEVEDLQRLNAALKDNVQRFLDICAWYGWRGDEISALDWLHKKLAAAGLPNDVGERLKP